MKQDIMSMKTTGGWKKMGNQFMVLLPLFIIIIILFVTIIIEEGINDALIIGILVLSGLIWIIYWSNKNE